MEDVEETRGRSTTSRNQRPYVTTRVVFGTTHDRGGVRGGRDGQIKSEEEVKSNDKTKINKQTNSSVPE